MTATEFSALLMSRGFPLSEIDKWNTGDLIDWCREHDRLEAKRRGIDLPDPYGEYIKLKAMEPEVEKMHEAGQLRETKYISYRQALDRYEAQLGV